MGKWPGPVLVRYTLLDLFELFTSPTSMVDHSHLIFTYHPTWKRRWQSRSQRFWTWHQQSFRHRQPYEVTRVNVQEYKIWTSICSFMTSPQAGAPTRPVPTLLDLGSILPTFLKGSDVLWNVLLVTFTLEIISTISSLSTWGFHSGRSPSHGNWLLAPCD